MNSRVSANEKGGLFQEFLGHNFQDIGAVSPPLSECHPPAGEEFTQIPPELGCFSRGVGSCEHIIHIKTCAYSVSSFGELLFVVCCHLLENSYCQERRTGHPECQAAHPPVLRLLLLIHPDIVMEVPLSLGEENLPKHLGDVSTDGDGVCTEVY